MVQSTFARIVELLSAEKQHRAAAERATQEAERADKECAALVRSLPQSVKDKLVIHNGRAFKFGPSGSVFEVDSIVLP